MVKNLFGARRSVDGSLRYPEKFGIAGRSILGCESSTYERQLKPNQDHMQRAIAPIHIAASLVLCITWHTFALPSSSHDAKDLTEQVPAVDDRVIAPPLLNGAVRHDQADEPLSAGDAKTQPEEGQISESSRRFKLNGKKSSSEDFRKLEYGILGMYSVRLPLASHYVVVKVVPGCPAAEGGIKPGDLQISTNGHVWTGKDTRKTYWQISDGRAGTPVDLVMLRKGETIQFHLVRMNIEDVPNLSIRRMYERMLEHFGAPTAQDLPAAFPSP